MQLSDEQIGVLNDRGCLVVPSLTPREEALVIRTSLEGLFARRAGEEEGAYGELAVKRDEDDEEPNSPQIRNPFNYAPELHKTACFANAQRIAKQILGPSARFIVDLAILKRAVNGEPTPWHQDLAFRDPNFKYREVTIWVALQDIDEKSGCLMFLPKSHRGPILAHRQLNQKGDSIALECVGDFDKESAFAGALPLGGCTVHFPGTLHCSKPNLSGVQRIAYIMTFGCPATVAEFPQHFPWRANVVSQMQTKRREWMLSGGAFVTAWRHLKNGDLNSWPSLRYWMQRAFSTIKKGA